MAHAVPQGQSSANPGTAIATKQSQPQHLHQKQLFALISLGQYTLHKLLEHFSLVAEPTATNGGEALSWIFTKRAQIAKNFQTYG